MKQIRKKIDKLALQAEQDFTHQSSDVIISNRATLMFEAAQIDMQISTLSASIANARDRRSKLKSQIDGLSNVLARRVESAEDH